MAGILRIYRAGICVLNISGRALIAQFSKKTVHSLCGGCYGNASKEFWYVDTDSSRMIDGAT